MSIQTQLDIHINPGHGPLVYLDLRELDGATAINIMSSESVAPMATLFLHDGESVAEDAALVNLIDDLIEQLVRTRTRALRRIAERREAPTSVTGKLT